MTHQDHKALLEKAGPFTGCWADLGSGDGAFTLALADLAKANLKIFSIDQDLMRLSRQRGLFLNQFPKQNITFLKQNITKDLSLPPLDGIIMANVLHFFKDKLSLLEHLKKYLKPKGRLIIIEYNTNTGTIWVPFPISCESIKDVTKQAGFTKVEYLHAVHSEYLNEIYSVNCQKI